MRRLLTLTVGALLMLSAPAGFTLGFGEIQLQSALNQPLKAQIPLLAIRPNERDQVSVEMASPDTFERFGIQRPGIVDQIDVRIGKRSAADGLQVLVSSRVPIQEPFLTFLVEANWPGGRAIREFTVLLDPPVALATTQAQADLPQPASAPQPQPQRQRAPAPAAPAPVESPPAAVTQRTQAPAPAPRASAAKRTYGPVAPGETLWEIGRKVDPAREYSIYQTMLAIYQANLSAFDKNLNLIHQGAVLKIPSKASIGAVNPSAAKTEVADQKRSFLAARAETQKNKSIQSAASTNGGPKVRLEPASDDTGVTSDPKTSDVANNDTAPGDDLDALVRKGKVEQPDAAARSAPSNDNSQSEAVSAAEPQAGDPTAPAAPADTAEDAATPALAAAPPGAATQPAPGSGSANNGQPNTEFAAAAEGDPADPAAAVASAAAGPGPGTDPDNNTNSAIGAEQTSATPASSPPPPNTGAAAQITQGGAAAATENDSSADPVPAQRAVAPAVFAGILSPRMLLLLLAGLLLIVALWMWWNRRQYKPMPADFTLDTPDDGDLDDTTQTSAAGAVASAGGVAAYAAVPRAVTPAASGATEGANDESSEAADVDDLLADADSLIENELYDDALAALELGLDTHPGHRALQRKILEVHHAAGEREAFMHKLERYFSDASPQDPDWLAVAAMARDFAPHDERFQSPEAPAVADAAVAPPEPVDEPSPWQPAESSTGTADDPTVAVDAPSDFYPFASEHDDANRPAAVFENDPWGQQSSALGEADIADEVPATESASTAQTSLDEEFSSDFDLSDFDTDFTSKEDEVPPATGGDAVPETVEFDISEFELADEGEASADNALMSGNEQPSPATAETDLEWPRDDALASETDSLEESIALDQLDLSAAHDSTQDEAVIDDSEVLSLENTDDVTPGPGTGPELINDDFGDDDDLEADDEVVTKLDLARAYIDMGEPEMAASLLQEVTSEGNAEQQQEAQLLLARAG